MGKKTFSRFLRKHQSIPEKLLWEHLRNRKFEGLKFKRQYPIGNFIVDFFCNNLKLVVEIDGKSHNYGYQKENDKPREETILSEGNNIFRIKNEEIISDINNVLNKLKLFINSLDSTSTPVSPSPVKGEGDSE